MSTDFYARLEQRRGSRPSEQTVGAIARALRLTQDERDHLFQLAGHTAPPRGFRTDHVSPALMRVLDRLDTPAQVVSDLGVTLAQNPLGEALMGARRTTRASPQRLSTAGSPTRSSAAASPRPTTPIHSRSYVAALRPVHGRTADDPEALELVDALLRRSPEFAAVWERHEVARAPTPASASCTPPSALMTLDCQILTAENLTERLVVFTATPGTEDAERLALLSVVGTQTFETITR